MCVRCGDLQTKQCSSGYRGVLFRKTFSHCVQASKIFEVTAATPGPVCFWVPSKLTLNLINIGSSIFTVRHFRVVLGHHFKIVHKTQWSVIAVFGRFVLRRTKAHKIAALTSGQLRLYEDLLSSLCTQETWHFTAHIKLFSGVRIIYLSYKERRWILDIL